jgi:hypothetical protein
MAGPDWAPSPDYVAALMHTRTRGRDSIAATAAREQGRFTANTRPTLVQVERLLELATGEVAATFPGRSPCTVDLQVAAGAAVAYRTAQLIEASLAPERTNYLGSAHEAYRTLADNAIRTVSAAIVAGCPLDS